MNVPYLNLSGGLVPSIIAIFSNQITKINRSLNPYSFNSNLKYLCPVEVIFKILFVKTFYCTFYSFFK